MTQTAITYQQRLMNFLDDKYINTGEDLDGKRVILAETCETYDLIERLHSLAVDMKNKGFKLNDFLKYFYVMDTYNNLHFSESYMDCMSCGNYAHHHDYGVQDQYYVHGCEVICKNCFDPPTYIEYLLENHNHCNVLLTDEQIKEHDYVELHNYEFEITMHSGRQADKEAIESILEGIEFFYYLNNCHMFGTSFTVCVHKDNLRKTLKALKNSSHSVFHN
jgi:hypothetical protein